MRGMVHDVFFWDHNNPEGGNDDTKSKVNPKEAEKAAHLALYLVRQGYPAGQVTLLTPYVGQLRLIIRELSKLMDVVVGDQDAEQLAALVSIRSKSTVECKLGQMALLLASAQACTLQWTASVSLCSFPPTANGQYCNMAK